MKECKEIDHTNTKHKKVEVTVGDRMLNYKLSWGAQIW